MTLQIDLTRDEESEIAKAASALGMEKAEYVRYRLLMPSAADDSLAEDELVEIRAGIRRGLEDASSGRTRPLEIWAAEKRAKYQLPDDNNLK